MSERGSFCTEYIYCNKCFDAVWKYFNEIKDEKFFNPVKIGDNIIAGNIGGLWAGQEIHDMEYEIAPRLESLVCCPLRIAVMAEEGSQIFVISRVD
jgi:hypothetical protein